MLDKIYLQDNERVFLLDNKYSRSINSVYKDANLICDNEYFLEREGKKIQLEKSDTFVGEDERGLYLEIIW